MVQVLGSTRLVTNRDGNIFERIDYLPFGEIFCDDIAENGGYEGHRHKYTDQMYDYLTGLYYYGSRYYDPELGRFAQADTMVPRPLDGQAFNRYTYVDNNPYKYIDPSGHFGIFAKLLGDIGGAIGYVLGGLVGAWAGYKAFGPFGALLGAYIGSRIGYWKGKELGTRIGHQMDVAAVQIAGVAFQVTCFVSQLAAMAGIGWGFGNPLIKYRRTAAEENKDPSSTDIPHSDSAEISTDEKLEKALSLIEMTTEYTKDPEYAEAYGLLKKAERNGQLHLIDNEVINNVMTSLGRKALTFPIGKHIFIFDINSPELDVILIHESSHYRDLLQGGVKQFLTDYDDPESSHYMDPNHPEYSRAYTLENKYLKDRYKAEGAIIRGKFRWP